jgi:hypothetical protein
MFGAGGGIIRAGIRRPFVSRLVVHDSHKQDQEPSATVTEVVGRFADRPSFNAAVQGLLAVGFEPTDLSVLDTHESLGTSDPHKAAWGEALAELMGEKYVGPITAAGLVMLAAGPVGAAIAGTLAAGLTGVALSELLDKVRATPHSEAFARALENGAVLLWARIENSPREEEARAIMARHGGEDVHVHERALQA